MVYGKGLCPAIHNQCNKDDKFNDNFSYIVLILILILWEHRSPHHPWAMNNILITSSRCNLLNLFHISCTYIFWGKVCKMDLDTHRNSWEFWHFWMANSRRKDL